MARAGLAIGGVVMIGVGAAIGVGWWWPTTAEATGRVGDRVHTVQIDNESGDVAITAADVGQTTVQQTFHYNWDEPGQAYQVADGELTLNGCGWMCSVDYVVTVPLGTKVTGQLQSGDLEVTGVATADVHSNSGAVTVRDVNGPVTVEADSGDIELSGLGASATVDSSSGSVTARDMRGPVEASVSSGDVLITLAEPEDVQVSASSGDVSLRVPRVAYHVEGSTDSGGRSIEVPRDSASPHLLQLNASSGDVIVRSTQP